MIVIIDYGLGNLGSVKNALDTIGIESITSSSVKDIEIGSGLILPGVGSASEGIRNLRKSGLDKAIKGHIKKNKPILGICLGMQLLFTRSEEGEARCLDVIEGEVHKLTIKEKVPHMGWNQVVIKDKESQLFANIPDNRYFYFVHSYYCKPKEKKILNGSTNYDIDFCSSIQKNTVFGVQFHPEKSGENGLRLLQNFAKIVYANNPRN